MRNRTALRDSLGRIGGALRVAVIAVAALYVAYVAVINTLLWTGGLDWLLHELAPVIRLRTGRSYSLWFFRVELRDLRLSAMDSNIHLELEVPRGSVQIRPQQLLSSTFGTSYVRGEGFVFRLRPNYVELPPERRRALPDLIDGTKFGPPSDPEDLWGYDFRGLDIDFDELWISEFRYTGPAHVRGGFSLQPKQEVGMYPSDVLLSGGTLHFGRERDIARPLHARVEVAVPKTRFDAPLEWEKVALRSKLDANVVDADVLRAYTSAPAPWRVAGGPLRTTLDAELRDDRLDARFRTAFDGVSLSKGEVALEGDAILSGRWFGKGSELPAGLLLDGFVDMGHARVRHPDFDVKHWAFRLDFPRLEVKRDPLFVQGPFFASAEDARPLARLLKLPKFPGPFGHFLTLPDLGVVGSLYVTEGARKLRVDRGTSDTIDVRGAVIEVQGAMYGAVLLQADPLSVGVHTSPDGTDVNPWASEAWLDEKLEELPKFP